MSEKPTQIYGIYFSLALALLTIISALFLEYVMGFTPCALCYTQRYIWYAILAVSLMACFYRCSIFRFILIFLFIVSAGYGLYHTGILYDFWTGPQSCTGTSADITSLAQADFSSISALTYAPLCSSIDQKILGMPLALGNFFLSSFGVLGNIILLKRRA